MNKPIFLDAQTFARAMISGSNALQNTKNKIDALNVFPVPDGDTGTNMASTIAAIVPKMKLVDQMTSISEVTKQISLAMVYEARGNSGVILSQIFKGFSLGSEGKEFLSLADFLAALQAAVDRAYKSVFKPVEGTILTVIRETVEAITKEYKTKLEDHSINIQEVFGTILRFCRKACDETPNKLKILREVGVTDSGGEGLYQIFYGFNEALNDRFVEISSEAEDIELFISDSEVYEGEFGYCTEVLVDLNNPEQFDKTSLTPALEVLASSLVIVNDENILKVHGHTKTPGNFLNLLQTYGEFIKIKSENMSIQANNSKANSQKLKSAQNQEDRQKCGLVSCNIGQGLIDKMHELGANFVIEAGETKNPSAQEIINAIDSVNANTVFVLPNSSNAILVAQQAAQVVDDKNVVVIPTKSQIQGLNAVMNFSPELDFEDNQEMMHDAINEVAWGEITIAVRNTTINGINIEIGNYLSILNGKIIAASKTEKQALRNLTTKMIKGSSEIISIFYGEDGSEQNAQELANYLESRYDIEVQIDNGNQPNYHYLIGVE